MTNNYGNNSQLLTMEKQSQSNPIYSVFIRGYSWLISKRTQTKPILQGTLRTYSAGMTNRGCQLTKAKLYNISLS